MLCNARMDNCLPWSELWTMVSRPVGGILSGSLLPGSPCVAIHLCGLPGDCPLRGGTVSPNPTLDLAPSGGCQLPGSLPTLVRSYRTVSPLPVPVPPKRRRPSAVCSLLPGPTGCPALTLVSTLTVGVPTFLDTHGDRSPRVCRGHPTDSPSASVSPN